MLEVREETSDEVKLTSLKANVEGNAATLCFKWPNELEQVYIYKKNVLDREKMDWEKPYRKYTKNEYTSFGGFKDEQVGVGLIEYCICPYIRNRDEAYLIDYKDGSNRIQVFTQKIAIKYELREKKKLFGHTKQVQMRVFCETDLPRETLCYVKKKGCIPVNSKDGMQFKFISDFVAGDNVLPEIEMDKDEYLRIYLSDQVEHKEIYGVYKQ